MYKIAAVAAAGLATSAWLNGKYQLGKDVEALAALRQATKRLEAAAKANRISPWYMIEEQVNRLPSDYQAIWSAEQTYTYREMYAQACRYAQFIIQAGWKPGELVGVCLQNSADFMVIFAAIWALGTAPALYNYNLGGDALVHCVKVSGVRIVLTDADRDINGRVEGVRHQLEGELDCRIIVWDDDTRRKADGMNPLRPGDEYRAHVKLRDPAMLLYTSGTTGFPKACAFSIDRYWLSFPSLGRAGIYSGPNGSRWYNCMPLYHGTGATTATMCLTRGITLCIGKKFSASRFWDEIRASGATAFVYVGEIARYLLAAPESPLDRQHNVTTMLGNGLRPDVWTRFRDRFGITTVAEFFNSTEGVLSLLTIARGDFLAATVGHHGLITRTMFRNTYVPVEIDPATDEPVRDPATGFGNRQPYSVGGEMMVQVPDTEAFIGYWENQAATDKKFVRNLFKKGDLFYRSGDALRRDDNGRWYFLDRLGDTYRWKSENVSTAEVAETIGSFPGIDEANVYGVLVPRHDGRAGCAALYLSSSVTQSTSSLEGFCRRLLEHMRAHLPRYAVPVFLRILEGPVQANMHNYKQNKVPLRAEGVDPDKVERGVRANTRDSFLWLPQPRADKYEPFSRTEWEKLSSGSVKL